MVMQSGMLSSTSLSLKQQNKSVKSKLTLRLLVQVPRTRQWARRPSLLIPLVDGIQKLILVIQICAFAHMIMKTQMYKCPFLMASVMMREILSWTVDQRTTWTIPPGQGRTL